MGAGDYVKREGVPDFRSAWDEMDESTELADSYGLGQRDSMQEAVEAVIAILGMQVVRPACPELSCQWRRLLSNVAHCCLTCCSWRWAAAVQRKICLCCDFAAPSME